MADAAWPERIHVIEGGRITFKGGLGTFHFDPGALADFLERRR